MNTERAHRPVIDSGLCRFWHHQQVLMISDEGGQWGFFSPTTIQISIYLFSTVCQHWDSSNASCKVTCTTTLRDDECTERRLHNSSSRTWSHPSRSKNESTSVITWKAVTSMCSLCVAGYIHPPWPH